MSEEYEVLIRKPSQLVNTGVFLFGSVFLVIAFVAKPYLLDVFIETNLLVIGSYVHKYYFLVYLIVALWMFYEFLVVYVTSWEISEERIVHKHGILIRYNDHLELFRVKDWSLTQPLIYRIFGLSNLVLHTSDASDPILPLNAIPKGNDAIEAIRERVDHMRQRKGVREID